MIGYIIKYCLIIHIWRFNGAVFSSFATAKNAYIAKNDSNFHSTYHLSLLRARVETRILLNIYTHKNDQTNSIVRVLPDAKSDRLLAKSFLWAVNMMKRLRPARSDMMAMLSEVNKYFLMP